MGGMDGTVLAFPYGVRRKKMRKALMLGTVLAVLVALVPIAASAQSGEAYDQSYARLTFVKGEVSVERGSELGTESAEVNLPVAEGNKLMTADGEAEVQFGRRNFLRLGVSSEAEFAALPKLGDDHVKIHLRAGQAYLRVTTLEGEKSIEVHTPDASFYILEEGLYRFDVGQGDATEILVHEGSAEAAGEGGSVVVRANERLVAANGEIRSDPESFRAAMDGFDRWNETRDGLLDRRATTSYLPSSISEYEDELDDNGRWVREESFGNVWVPYVQDVEWRPYLYGRWVWYPIIGWTWVSSEPWGWSTYHYGRWQWGFGLGWYWIPTTHWGPAWVHWYHGRDHYGWCPLSYYDRPGLLIDGRYHDRWHGDDYPWNSRALTVVRRDRLQSPAISRHALRSSELGALGRIAMRAEQPVIRPASGVGRTGLASPVSGRALSATGSRATITERGSLSKGTLRSPASGSLSGISSRSRTWTSTGGSASTGSLSGSVSGSISKLRTYPSRGADAASSGTARSSTFGRIRSNDVVERPSGVSSGRSSGGIKTYVPKSSVRSYSGSGTSSPSGGVKGYPSIIRNKTTSTPSLRSYGSVREYSPSSTVRSYSSRSNSSGSLSRSSGSSSGSSYSRSYSAPRSSARPYSYSAPSYSGRSSSSNSGYSRGYSEPRSYSYSAPSYSGRSYSSGSLSRSSGSYTSSSSSRSYSAPRSSGSSKGSVSSSSRSSSSSHSSSSSRSSSSSGRSGSIRKK